MCYSAACLLLDDVRRALEDNDVGRAVSEEEFREKPTHRIASHRLREVMQVVLPNSVGDNA